MTVKDNYTTSNVIFQKTREDFTVDEEGYFHFVILPEDTDDLSYGEYPYDIEIVIFGGKPITIKKSMLRVTKEVTHKINEI